MNKPPPPSDPVTAIAERVGALALALRFGPAVAVAVLAIWVWSSGLLGHLTLDDLGRSRMHLQAFVAAHPVQSLLLYILAFAGAVTLCLPAVLLLGLTGGFLFGAVEGGLAAMVAQAAGGAAIFLICRTAMGDSIKRLAGPKIHRLQAAARKDALGLMLTLRLVPMTPFWLINIGAAALDVPLRPFVIGAVVGILPSALIYATLGSGLGRMFDSGARPSLEMALQPRVLAPLIALIALAVIPLAWRLWRRRTAAADTP